MNHRLLAKTAGISYLIIFFAAIFGNFLALDPLLADPYGTVMHNSQVIRFGILAFLVAALFDVVVAWSLFEMYKNHVFTRLSTYLRVIHATIMSAALFALPMALQHTTNDDILLYAEAFNNMWLIGLFFFGAHLLLLARIAPMPKWIALFMSFAGVMYMADSAAHFVLPNYDDYATIALTLVAIPSILGEMAFAFWLLQQAGK